MAEYNRYAPRRSRGSSAGWRWIFVFIVGLVLVIVFGRMVFGNPNTPGANTNEPTVQLVNDNRNVGLAMNTNSIEPDNGNTNSAVTVNSGDVDLDNCGVAVSSFGTLKRAVLTYNLAAANAEARAVVDALKELRTPAAFFASGTFAEAQTEFLADVRDAGFPIYSRAHDNSRWSELSDAAVTEQLEKTEAAFGTGDGESPKPFVRPPYGDTDASAVTAAQNAGYCTVLWTVDALDWQAGATAATAQERVMKALRPGAIIMLSAGFDSTAAATRALVPAIKGAGYELVSLSDLFVL